MLRVGKLRSISSKKADTAQAAPVARPEPTDPWQALGYPGLANTVRQICTLCGWARSNGRIGQTLSITSAVTGEGKSSLARAIAVSTARDHAEKVLLIECDLLRPTLSADLDLDLRSGLSDVLAGQTDLEAAVHHTDITNLWVLPAGSATDNPSRLLRSPVMADVIASARAEYAFIVLDLPAVLLSNDAAVLAALTDGVIVVVRGGSTEQGAVQQTVRLLGDANIHGLVLNRWQTAIPQIVRRVIEQ